jgi:hypothetical protein
MSECHVDRFDACPVKPPGLIIDGGGPLCLDQRSADRAVLGTAHRSGQRQ